MSDTIIRQHWQAKCEAAEARCKQKDAALRIALEELEFDRDFAVVKGSGEKRKVDEAIGLVRTALSDTAQQRDCPGCEGRGSLMGTNCDECKGTGRIPIDPETGGADG